VRAVFPRILDYLMLRNIIWTVPAPASAGVINQLLKYRFFIDVYCQHEAIRNISPGTRCLEAVLPMSPQSASRSVPATISQPLPVDSRNGPISFEEQSATSRQSREGPGQVPTLNSYLSSRHGHLCGWDVRSDQA
jgi:hypothetical protein